MQLSPVVSGSLLIASVLGSGVTSTRALRQNRFEVKPSYQPRDRAFSIWGAIFATSVAHGVLMILDGAQREDVNPSTVMAAGAYALCTLWALSVERNDSALAALCLVAASGVATAAACRTPRPVSLTDWVFVDVPLSLLSGWLLIAASLSVSIALLDRGVSSLDATWVILIPISLACIVGTIFSKPFLLLPTLWATLFLEMSIPAKALILAYVSAFGLLPSALFLTNARHR